MTPLYFDANATTPIDPLVAQAIQETLLNAPGNPASPHGPGRHARQLLETAREGLLSDLGAAADDRLVFTSGGTESNNLALSGLPAHGAILVSALEHPSIRETAAALAAHGREVETLPATSAGIIDVAALERRLQSGPVALVAIMYGNNETGVLQPVETIGQLCAEHGVPWHCDAVQALGKLPFDLQRLRATTISITAHKLHGPVGIGGLVVRQGLKLDPLLRGGAQQLGLRPGRNRQLWRSASPRPFTGHRSISTRVDSG